MKKIAGDYDHVYVCGYDIVNSARKDRSDVELALVPTVGGLPIILPAPEMNIGEVCYLHCSNAGLGNGW